MSEVTVNLVKIQEVIMTQRVTCLTSIPRCLEQVDVTGVNSDVSVMAGACDKLESFDD